MGIFEPGHAEQIAVRRRGLTPEQTLVSMGLLTSGIFLLDLSTPSPIDVAIFYVLVVLLCLHSPWRQAPLLAAAIAIVLTCLPPAVFWPTPMDWFIGVNRVITCFALGLTAILVANQRTAEEALREGQNQLGMRVEERTTELRAANQALEAENAIRRAAEESLHESQDRLARTEAFSLVMVTHVGLDGQWLKVPARLSQLLGYSESELLARTFMDVTHPDDVEFDRSQCQRLIKGEIKSFELEKRHLRKDGGIVWIYLNCSGVYDAAGRLIHFLTYIQDISDRKRVEEALRLSEEKWRTVIETVPIGIGISTVDGRVIDANTAAWTILGYQSKEEFLRLAAASHYIDPADRQRRIERILAGQGVFEAQFKKKDGSLFWGRCTAAILGGQDDDVVLINAYEDITEERRYHDTIQCAKEELQAANQRLTERDHVRTKFLSVVSHELRTPMAAIKGFVDNMLDGVTGELNERQSDYLRRIQNSVERLTRLIAQLLDWSRLEMGGAPFLPKQLSPADLVRTVGDNARAMAEAKQVRVITRIELDLPTILADPDKLEQILWNLIGNAVKFTPALGTVTIECRTAPDGGVLFAVSDTGCGISPDDIPRVFDQFSGINSSFSSNKGAQLGLYITRSLVLMHGGRLWVESTLGEGSRFSVHLPIKPPEGARAASGL